MGHIIVVLIVALIQMDKVLLVDVHLIHQQLVVMDMEHVLNVLAMEQDPAANIMEHVILV